MLRDLLQIVFYRSRSVHNIQFNFMCLQFTKNHPRKNVLALLWKIQTNYKAAVVYLIKMLLHLMSKLILTLHCPKVLFVTLL